MRRSSDVAASLVPSDTSAATPEEEEEDAVPGVLEVRREEVEEEE